MTYLPAIERLKLSNGGVSYQFSVLKLRIQKKS